MSIVFNMYLTLMVLNIISVYSHTSHTHTHTHTSSPGITPGISSVKEGSEKGRTKYTTIVSCQKIDIKEIKAKQRTQINQVGTRSELRMTNQMSAYVKLHWF